MRQDPSLRPSWRFPGLSKMLLLFDFYAKVLDRRCGGRNSCSESSDGAAMEQQERSLMELLLQDALRSTSCIFPHNGSI